MRAADPLLVLPGNPTQASVELQVFRGSQVIKQGVKLRTVADTLLHLQQVLQDAAGGQRRLSVHWIIGMRNYPEPDTEPNTWN